MMKLNIRRFGTTVNVGAAETNADPTNNRSYITATIVQKADSNTYNNSGSAYYCISCDGKTTGNISYKFSGGSTKTFTHILGPYDHASDGSLANKTVSFVVHGDVKNGNHSFNIPVSFTKFNRYFSQTPVLNLNSKTNTSFTFGWSTSETASYVYWDIYDASGNFIGSSPSVGSGTSGTFTMTNLSGSTTYKVRIRAVRADSGLESTSATGTYTTYTTPTLALSLTSRTETSLKVKATPNVAVASKTWTVKNSGGTTVKTSTSTAETVEFTGLSANTNYTVYVSYVSTSANGSISSATYNATYATLQYPYVSAVGTSALTIGNSQTLTLYNPLSRSVTVYMKKDNTSGTQFYSGTTTGTSITFTPTANDLYTSIPNSTSGNCVYYCVYSNQNVGTKNGTYVTKGTELPTFGTNNWSYTANLTELTNNNQVVLPSHSTVTFRLDTVASGNNGASINSYNVIWDDTISLGGTTAGTTQSITGKTSLSLAMVAKDTRGYQTTTTKTLTSGTTYIPYIAPTIESISTHRTDGIQAETELNISGKFYATTFGGSTGSHTNTLYSAVYYTKTSSSSTWSSAYTIPVSSFTINTTNGTFSLSDYQIHANGSSGGFTVGTRYDVKVEIQDAKGLLATVASTSFVTDGKIARDVYQDSNGEYHEGINGRANSSYNEYINGSFKSTGNADVGGNQTVTGSSTINNGETVKRSADATTFTVDRVSGTGAATINFRNGNGMLGAIGMTGSANGRLHRWSKDYANDYEVIDRSVVKAAVSAKSHTNYNNNQTDLPTMNFLTYWNGAYNSSNSSNLTYAHQGTIQCKPTVLYNNATGTTGTITLSQTAANFTYIYVYAINSDSTSIELPTVIVYSPNGKTFEACSLQPAGDRTFGSAKEYTCSGSSITVKFSQQVLTFIQNGTFTRTAYENWKVIRVEGWK